MDDWTHPYPDVDPPATQPALLDQDQRAIEDRRLRAHQAEAARVAQLEHSDARDDCGDPHADAVIPIPFATPPVAALTF